MSRQVVFYGPGISHTPPSALDSSFAARSSHFLVMFLTIIMNLLLSHQYLAKRKMDAMELRNNFREKVKRNLPTKLKQLRSGRKHIRSIAARRIRNRAQAHESRLYSEYALLYDKTFGKIFYDRI
jgi:hypothetical protein